MPIPPARLLRQTSLAYRQYRHLPVEFSCDKQLLGRRPVNVCVCIVFWFLCAFVAATPPSLLQPSEPSRLKKKTYAKVTWLFSSGMHFLHSIVLWYPFRNMLSPPLNNVVASWKSFSCFMKLTCCILWKRWHKTPRPIVLVWCMLLFVRMGNLPEMK